MSETNPQLPVTARVVGIQRGFRFLIEISDLEAFSEPFYLEVVAKHPDGTLTDLALEKDISALDKATLDKLIKELPREDRADRKKRSHVKRFYARIPEANHCIRSISVFMRFGDDKVQVPWLSRQLSLELLIPLTRNEFSGYFTFRKGRNMDSETAMRCASSVLCFWINRDHQEIHPYIVNSFVVLVYKSIESGCHEEFQHTIRSLRGTILDMALSIGRGAGVREDRTQGVLSVSTALWHFAIATQDVEIFISSMKVVEDTYLDAIHSGNFRITYSLNITGSLLAYAGYLALRGKRDEAERRFLWTYEAFRAGVAADTINASWFKELGASHWSSYQAIRGLTYLRQGESLPDELVDKIARSAPRVKTEDFIDKVRAFLMGSS